MKIVKINNIPNSAATIANRLAKKPVMSASKSNTNHITLTPKQFTEMKKAAGLESLSYSAPKRSSNTTRMMGDHASPEWCW